MDSARRPKRVKAGHNEGTSLREDADTMRSVELRKRRSEMLPKACHRAEDPCLTPPWTEGHYPDQGNWHACRHRSDLRRRATYVP
jgi:hypothetical protein